MITLISTLFPFIGRSSFIALLFSTVSLFGLIAIVFKHRGKQNRLGFALQLGTVKFLGTCLSDPTAVAFNVYKYISQQLKISVDNISHLSYERKLQL
ncbi:MAG: hypothetical protein CVV03_04400 [Firmicutes bacterium HGW-Firmicutes-8]|nr:MAG: hypothetical protein CVV03_04400 [Firmicutes bacterium HGW-Firmicutes-8]